MLSFQFEKKKKENKCNFHVHKRCQIVSASLTILNLRNFLEGISNSLFSVSLQPLSLLFDLFIGASQQEYQLWWHFLFICLFICLPNVRKHSSPGKMAEITKFIYGRVLNCWMTQPLFSDWLIWLWSCHREINNSVCETIWPLFSCHLDWCKLGETSLQHRMISDVKLP